MHSVASLLYRVAARVALVLIFAAGPSLYAVPSGEVPGGVAVRGAGPAVAAGMRAFYAEPGVRLAEPEQVRSEYGVARMFAVPAGDGTIYAGLHLSLDPAWHSYWKNPGDSGMATRIDWELPEGFTAGPILWPVPRRIYLPPLMSYGFEGDVVLLTRIHAPSSVLQDDAQANARISARVEWLECKEICLPGEGRFELEIAPRMFREQSRAVDRLQRFLPREFGGQDGAAAELRITGESLSVRATLPPGLSAENLDPAQIYFFAEAEGLAAHAEAQSVNISATEVSVRVPLDANAALQGDLSDANLRGVLLLGSTPGTDDVLAWQLDGSGASSGAGRILLMLLFAFAGGLILNLMPCVLPVLSLKVLALLEHRDGRGNLRSGLWFTLGVLVSFWALAGVLLALKAGGEAVGWGYQLQSPGFVFVLGLVLFAFALNLLGAFEIGVPGGAIVGTLTDGSGAARHFFTGVLAVIVATPCTAPFMGTAMGFAFTQGAFTALGIFTFLGAGMAAPVLLFAAFPAALAYLPKPGRWMESLKQFFGFLLLATVLWLLWLIGRLAGPDALVLALAALLLTGLAAWIAGRWAAPLLPAGTRRLALGLAGVLVLSALSGAYLIEGFVGTLTQRSDPGTGIQKWEEFSPDRLAELRAQGTPVFIDFTADWCLSCKVNEALTFESPAVWDAMAERGIVALKADWTRRQPEISRALESYGRSGVPLYVLYAGGVDAEPQLLPEVLTESLFLGELERLKVVDN